MNRLYGTKYIEKQRRSGYKSTIYAMAEIVDNSVDAKASCIDIIIVTDEVHVGRSRQDKISEIIFVDNGKGMQIERLNGCLKFSEGEGRQDGRIGAFGVGLPNSSISVCRRVDVYSKDNKQNWNHVFLDLDDQLDRDEPGYDDAVQIDQPDVSQHFLKDSEPKTIVRWTKIDLIDTSNPEILRRRLEKLMGRIYRYSLGEGLVIRIGRIKMGNSSFDGLGLTEILGNDPLYVSKKKTLVTDLIWKSATEQEPIGVHDKLGHLEDFQSSFHYKTFIEGCKVNETNKPLFQKCDDYWDVPYTVSFGNKTFTWKIRASFAYKAIRNPGITKGGDTAIGREFGKKMSGDRYEKIKSANIFFMRSGREIDFGHFGLYTVTDTTNRFWTIEIHFDQDL